MAITLNEISRWLEEDDTKHQVKEEKDLIVFGAQGDVKTAHFIKLRENGDMFKYEIQMLDEEQNMFKVDKNHQYIQTILEYLLYENYNTKFGCWEYDYNDGDLKYTIEIPLEDATMTQKQLKRISSLAFGDVDTMFNNITKILKTGEMPEDDDSSTDDLLKKLLLLKALENGDLSSILDDNSSDEDSSDDVIDVDIDDDDGI